MAGTSIFAGISPSLSLLFLNDLYFKTIILYYTSLGPGSVVGGKGKKQDETGRKSASEASQVVDLGVGEGRGAS